MEVRGVDGIMVNWQMGSKMKIKNKTCTLSGLSNELYSFDIIGQWLTTETTTTVQLIRVKLL